MEYSVIIPVFNEEESLQILYSKIKKVMQDIEKEYEVIFVDDASTDNSLEIIKKLKSKHPFIKIISFKSRRGQSTALWAGFKKASGKWIITLDADLQNDPEDIKIFLPFQKSYDFITGIRKDRKDAFFKKMASKVAYLCRRIVLKDDTLDVGCSLRMFRREILDNFPFFKNFHRFFPYLVKMTGYRTVQVYVNHYPRRFGKSKYGIWRRFIEGVFDLWGVWWLKRRVMKYEVKFEQS